MPKLIVEGEDADQVSYGFDDLESDLRSLGIRNWKLKLETEINEGSCERGQGPFHWTVEPYIMMEKMMMIIMMNLASYVYTG